MITSNIDFSFGGVNNSENKCSRLWAFTKTKL